MYRASRVERSLRSVPPRVSNFFLSVSRSTVPANAKADLSRRAFLRVEEAMRNWPRPMKIRTIRLYVTRERCIFHLVSLSLSLFPFPLFLQFSQDEMDLNERDRAAQLRYLSRRFLVRIATIDLYFSANLSPSRLLLCQPRPEEKVAKPRRILSGRKTATSRRTSRPMIARSLART